MFDNIRKIFTKTKYNYVAPCPHCNSPKTGYVINNRDTINLQIEKEKVNKMLNGEIVEIHSYFEDNDNRLFCLDCGLEWSGIPEIKYLTDEEIKNERDRRGITDDFILERNFTFKNMLYLKKRMKKERKRQEKLAKSSKNIQNVKVKQEIKSQKTNNYDINIKVLEKLSNRDIILSPGPKFKNFKIN